MLYNFILVDTDFSDALYQFFDSYDFFLYGWDCDYLLLDQNNLYYLVYQLINYFVVGDYDWLLCSYLDVPWNFHCLLHYFLNLVDLGNLVHNLHYLLVNS